MPEADYFLPLGVADIKRRDGDVSLVAIASGLPVALQAVQELEGQGISAGVIDPRNLVPLDKGTILASLAKTGRLVVDPAHPASSAASEIAAVVAEQGFGSLRAAILRVSATDTQVPFAPELEAGLFPSKDRVVAGVKEVLAA